MTDKLINRLREVREVRGWTQAELASRMGVSRKTVNTVENGVFLPSTIVALKAARVFKTSVESLFSLAERED